MIYLVIKKYFEFPALFFLNIIIIVIMIYYRKCLAR